MNIIKKLIHYLCPRGSSHPMVDLYDLESYIAAMNALQDAFTNANAAIRGLLEDFAILEEVWPRKCLAHSRKFRPILKLDNHYNYVAPVKRNMPYQRRNYI